MDPLRKLCYSLATLIVLIGGGTIGYTLIEEWPAFESLYMTIITLSTVGYREVNALSFEGLILAFCLLFSVSGSSPIRSAH